jgi:hypothetical protein
VNAKPCAALVLFMAPLSPKRQAATISIPYHAATSVIPLSVTQEESCKGIEMSLRLPSTLCAGMVRLAIRGKI